MTTGAVRGLERMREHSALRRGRLECDEGGDRRAARAPRLPPAFASEQRRHPRPARLIPRDSAGLHSQVCCVLSSESSLLGRTSYKLILNEIIRNC